MYLIENYKDNIRFHNQYNEIRDFLLMTADGGYNEHFHWGRFDWMMAHEYLDVGMLSRNTLFRDESGKLVGAILYDTSFHDRWYLLHSTSEASLLRCMIEFVARTDPGPTTIKANLNDSTLCMMLEKTGFKKQHTESVLEIGLSSDHVFRLPQGFTLNTPDSEIDKRQWQLVIYHGFDHKGIPEAPGEELLKAQRHLENPKYIKVFAMKGREYAAHCGVWYDGGDTAYIEPVVVIPEYRGDGLGKAVVYEAINRAKERGAKRAIVLSNLEFYKRIGMTKSSEVGAWVKEEGQRPNYGNL